MGLFFVILTSLVTYYSARLIEKASGEKKRVILIVSVLVCFFILVILKYILGLSVINKSLTILNYETTIHNFVKTYLIPIGISYYTLQVVSYILDVYWGRCQAEQSYLKVLLFTCYFPQMVQGPISKYSELSTELFSEHKFSWKNIKFGVQLMIWGYFKKMIIADRIGLIVNAIFHGGETPYGIVVIAGLMCYGIQLYCDFSGGIDVVRGVSELFGIGLKDNFRQPYFSLSLSEFWRRWHISLGQWMKDYIFYPVSMSGWMLKLKKFFKKIASRKTSNRISMAVADIVVFVFVGLWHGLGSNYLGWGLYNGIIIAFSTILVDEYDKLKRMFNIDDKSNRWKVFCLIRTLTIVTIGWVFDCAYTAKEAIILLVHMLSIARTDWSMIIVARTDILILLIAIFVLLLVDILHEKGISIRENIGIKNYLIQVVFWTVVVQLIACFGRIASAEGFMYANF
jgi:D-alanyl-lipoteichoic acid acyltransferase DltB (MBOAT superfamily)